MYCKHCKELMPDFLRCELDRDSEAQFKEHISECEKCRIELEDMQRVWSTLLQIPQEEPSPQMLPRFYSMLATYREGQNIPNTVMSPLWRLNEWIAGWWPQRPVIQLAAAFSLLVIGIVTGFMIESHGRAGREIARLEGEIHETRQLVTLALLEQPSAVERLRGVAMSRELTETNNQVASMLLKTLNTDPNINVRIAAADAIRNYCDRDWVRIELIHSLISQTSPLIQVSLIDVLTSINEKRAAVAFESIIDNEDNIEPVKKRARLALDAMI